MLKHLIIIILAVAKELLDVVNNFNFLSFGGSDVKSVMVELVRQSRGVKNEFSWNGLYNFVERKE